MLDMTPERQAMWMLHQQAKIRVPDHAKTTASFYQRVASLPKRGYWQEVVKHIERLTKK